MSKFPEFRNDLQFTEKLVTEQSVFCLPAKVGFWLRKSELIIDIMNNFNWSDLKEV